MPASLSLRNRFGYVAFSAGAVGLLLTIFRVISGFRPPFHFGYTAGRVNLTIVNWTVDTVIWLTAIIIFSLYPVVCGRKRFRVILVHALLPFSILLFILNHGTSAVLAVNFLLAFSISIAGSQRTFNIPRHQAVVLILAVLTLTLIPIEVLATFSILSDPAALMKLYESAMTGLDWVGRLSLSLFYSGDVAAGNLLLLLLFLPLVLIIVFVIRGRDVFILNSMTVQPDSRRFSYFTTSVLLAGIVCLAALTAVLPYVFHPVAIGVDAKWYLTKSNNVSGLTCVEPRAPYLFLLFALRTGFGLSPVSALEVGAAVLSILSVIGTFLLAWEAVHRTDVALLSGFLACFAPQLLIGTFAGIFEAWLMFSESLFFFGLFLYASRRSASTSVAAGPGLVSIIMLFTHPWTWLVLILILAGQLLILVIQSKSSRNLPLRKRLSPQLKVLALSLIIGAVAFTVGSSVCPAMGTARDTTMLTLWSSFASPLSFLNNVSRVLVNFVGGFYSNWILLGLAALGVFATTQLEREVESLVDSWILVSAFTSLFLIADVQWRLLYLLPYSFLAALGIHLVFSQVRARAVSRNGQPGYLLFYLLEWGCIALVGLMFWNNLLRSMVFISASF